MSKCRCDLLSTCSVFYTIGCRQDWLCRHDLSMHILSCRNEIKQVKDKCRERLKSLNECPCNSLTSATRKITKDLLLRMQRGGLRGWKGMGLDWGVGCIFIRILNNGCQCAKQKVFMGAFIEPSIWSSDAPEGYSSSRPERWIVTIPSSDQWLATIENHWKTIVSNGCQTTKPLKNHWYQWFSDQKPLENHCYQWFWRPKTIVKPLTSMVAFQPFI